MITADSRVRYKKLVRKISKLAEANEPDTLGYYFYFNRDETRCVVHEIFANSDAVTAACN